MATLLSLKSAQAIKTHQGITCASSPIYRNIQMGPSITLQLLMSNKPHGLINEDPKPQIRRQGAWRFFLETPPLEDNSEMQ
jgi:hypothetical protein